MSNFQNFQEYLDAKGKTQDTPIIKADGDTAPEPTVKPPKAATKGKNWSFPAPKDEAKPYSAAGVKDGYGKAEKGLGNTGDKRLKWEPKTTKEHGEEESSGEQSWPNQKEDSPWQPNTAPQQEFPKMSEWLLERKSKMQIEVDNIPTVYAHREGRIMPDPMESIIYSSFIINENDRFLEALVIEMKKKGGLKKLMEKTLKYTEDHSNLGEILKKTASRKDRHKIVESLSEMTASPAAKDIEDDDDEKKN